MDIPETISAPQPSHIDVQVIMSGIRRRVRAENQREAGALRSARKSLPADLIARVSRLQARMSGLRASVAQIGEMPPAPPTLRGRMGALAVGIMRRSLFWLIPNLQAVQQQMVAVVDEQVKALDEVVTALEKTNIRMELLIVERKSAQAGPHDSTQETSADRELPI